MRTIKFRGLDEDGVWHYGFYCVNNFGEHTIFNEDDTRGPRFAKKVRPETVGESIGSGDKNGKEIYEGDILSLGGAIGIVGWCDVCARFEFQVPVTPYDPCCGWQSMDRGLDATEENEVIGDVHQNPELLTRN